MSKAGTVRLVDVAKRVGVSHAAVSSVLSVNRKGSIRVGKATSENIRRVAREMDYQPNIAARQLKGKRSHIVGVIIDSYAPQIAFDRLSEIEQSLNRYGYRLMVGQSHGDIKHLQQYAADFLSHGVDGVVCISHDYPDSGAKVAGIYSRFKNIVFIGKPSGQEDKKCYIDIDIADGIQQAFNYLNSNGKTPVGLFLSDLDCHKSRERKKGFVQAHSDTGVKYDESLIHLVNKFTDKVEDKDFDKAVDHLVRKHRAKAIIAINDVFAIHTINALMRMGLSVPDDIAVIGCDNVQFASMFNPPLTTIDQRPGELSEVAVNMLLEMIKDRKGFSKPRHVVLKPKLVIRQSA